MRRLLLAAALAATIAATGADAGAPSTGVRKAQVSGAVRVLVVLATWGPRPFTEEQARRVVFDETDAFFRAASYGRASLTGTVTPWLDGAQPVCDPLRFENSGRAVARAAGYDGDAYDHVVYVHPQLDCAWQGVAAAGDVVLNGALYRKLVAHELGHTFGLYHANTAQCSNFACVALEYGDPYDTMGGGDGDFNAYEKYRLGWLPKVAWAQRNSTVDVDRLERAASGPQALVVKTAGEQYWLDNRRGPARSDDGDALTPGVLVHIGPPRLYPTGVVIDTTSDTLLVDPARKGRAALLKGDRFAIPGAFAVTVLRSGDRARLRFRWTDRTAPAAPKNVTAVTRRSDFGESQLRVRWDDARETGSGVDHYEVVVDGRQHARIAARPGKLNELGIVRPAGGRHVVRVVAVDRAGNRSAPSSYRFALA